ncbi:MAG: tetratricopeptide repeat protein, partial [Roseiflexaceae bacterium]
LHAMAGVLVTRGDLDGAMRLYEQSKEIDEALGDVRGKGVTLANMAQILSEKGELEVAQWYYEQCLAIFESLRDIWGQAHVLRMLAPVLVRKGEREKAVAGLRGSLAIFERLGATREIAPVQQLIEQLTSMSEGEPPATTPARLAGTLVAMTTAALRGDESGEQARAALGQAAQDARLGAYAAALAAAIDRAPGAGGNLLAAARAALAEDADQWSYGDTLAGVGNVAALLGDAPTEQAAREESLAALRRTPQDERTRRSLRSAIRNLSVLHYNREDFAAALPLMEEALALTPPGQDDPDLRAAVEIARRRAAGQPEPTLRDAIVAWRDGDRDAESLAGLLNLVCNVVVASIQAGDHAIRDTLAQDLAQLRAARPLPTAGAGDFLHVLQLRLRDEPAMHEQAARIAAGLPGMFQDTLSAIERLIAGEDAASDAVDDAEEDTESAALASQLATMLEAAPPERRPALAAALTQTMPFFQAVEEALANPQITAQERALLAARLDEIADQAAAGEQPGSPWLDAASALRAAGALLRGGAPGAEELAEPFRTLLAPLIERPGEAP